MLFSVIAIFLLLLNLFGVMQPANAELERTLTQQLEYSADRFGSDMEQLAAVAAAFSNEMSNRITSQGLSFDALQNDQKALLALQLQTYPTVYNFMQRAECSGAFYLLNTTVNDALPDHYYDGIYLKYANLSSETTVRNSVRMYRGNVNVARRNDINLHSTWEYETKAGTFPQVEAVLQQAEAAPAKGYLLTTVYKLPDAWERVRFLCTPITDASGEIIGVCGFEISDLFFRFSYPASAGEQNRAVCALLTEDAPREYVGQLSGNRSGYAPDLDGRLTLSQKDDFSVISNGKNTFIGKTKDIPIGRSTHTMGVLLPEGAYLSYLHEEQAKTVLLLFAVAMLAVSVSFLVSRWYVTPIQRSMERLKTRQYQPHDTHIPEINDLFAYLAEQDRIHEATLSAIEREKADSQSTLGQLKQEYDKLQEQLKQLAESKKEEIYSEEYAYFVKGIHQLSKKERAVFDYYMEGKSVKEIAALLQISEDGVRYHNKNIYATLGVKGLKQLRLFISIMKQEEEQAAKERELK